MRFKRLAILLVSSSVILTANAVQLDATDQVVNNYELGVTLETASLSRSISGYTDTGKINTSVNSIYRVAVDALFFPQTYRINIGYSTNISSPYSANVVNPAGFSSETDGSFFSAIPFYSKTYGGFSLQYKKAKAAGQFTNNTGANLPFHIATSSSTSAFIANIANGTTFKSKDVMGLTEIAYLVPETRFLPEGFNISYTIANRETVNFMTINGSPYLMYIKGDLNMTGIGIVRGIDELPEGFSFRKVKYSTGTITAFNDIEVQEVSLAVSYKAKTFYIDAEYSKFDTSSKGFTVGGLAATMPSMTDNAFFIKAGMTF